MNSIDTLQKAIIDADLENCLLIYFIECDWCCTEEYVRWFNKEGEEFSGEVCVPGVTTKGGTHIMFELDTGMGYRVSYIFNNSMKLTEEGFYNDQTEN